LLASGRDGDGINEPYGLPLSPGRLVDRVRQRVNYCRFGTSDVHERVAPGTPEIGGDGIESLGVRVIEISPFAWARPERARETT
jgi:hypothetical protein